MGFERINPVGLQQEQARDFMNGLNERFSKIEKRLDALEKSRKQAKKQEVSVDGDSNKSAS